MIRELSQISTNEVVGKVFGFGVALYVVALVAQVLQSYSLV